MAARKRLKAPLEENCTLERILKEVSDIVSLIDDAQRVMNELVRLTTSLLRVSNCSLVLLQPETDELRIHAAFGLDAEVVRNWRARVGQGITGWVARTGKPARVGDVQSDPRYILLRPEVRSELAVPL